MPICGHGTDVSKLVNALALGTGLNTLRSGTLLPLQGVISRTSIGSLRTSRAWCPACYQEDASLGRDLYDRLVWAIAPTMRCAIHRVALQDRCPSCGDPQFYSVRFRLDQCCSCLASLTESSLPLIRAELPAFGERLVHELVGGCAADPELSINRESIRKFFLVNRHELPKGDPLLSCRTLIGVGRPSLWTLIRMAVAFNVSLLDFQTSELPRATLPLFGSYSQSFPAGKRSRISQDVKEKVRSALKEALSSSCMPPSFSFFCKTLRVSPGYVSYQFPELARDYLQRRRSVVKDSRSEMLRAARVALDSGLLRRHESGEIHQLKELVIAVAAAAGVSIVTARKAVALGRASPDAGGWPQVNRLTVTGTKTGPGTNRPRGPYGFPLRTL